MRVIQGTSEVAIGDWTEFGAKTRIDRERERFPSGFRPSAPGHSYISFGASIASNQSPLASAWRVASTSASRALRTGSSEWMTGQA